jgi:hypothetical protein
MALVVIYSDHWMLSLTKAKHWSHPATLVSDVATITRPMNSATIDPFILSPPLLGGSPGCLVFEPLLPAIVSASQGPATITSRLFLGSVGLEEFHHSGMAVL